MDEIQKVHLTKNYSMKQYLQTITIQSLFMYLLQQVKSLITNSCNLFNTFTKTHSMINKYTKQLNSINSNDIR